MKFIQPIALDVSKCRLYKYLYAKQGDTDSRFIQATIISGGTKMEFAEGDTAKIRALKPDGTSVLNDAVIQEDNTVLAELTEQMLAVGGLVSADIVIFGTSGEVLSTANFRVEVETAPIGKTVTSSNEFLTLVNIIDRAEQTLDDYDTALEQLEGIRDQAQNSATSAGSAAASAASSSTTAQNQAAAARNAQAAAADSAAAAAESAETAKANADALDADLMNAKIDAKADNLWFDEDTSLLYLMSNGEIIGDGIKVSTSGGGGGGASQDYTITLQNLLESRILTAAKNTPVVLKFSYASVDAEGVDDGDGVGTVTVGGVRKGTVVVKQGENTVDVSEYLIAGSNTVKLRVENSEGVAKTLSYTVTVVALSLTTNFDQLASYSGAVNFAYILTGTGTKTVHFAMDGVEIGTAEVKTSGRSQSFTIPAQAYGGHLFSCYAEMTVDSVTVQSEPLTLGMIWTDGAGTAPAIAVLFHAISATEGETLEIPYIVHDPVNETATVTLSVIREDGTVYGIPQTISVDRTAQSWVVQDYPAGNIQFRITSGETTVPILGTITAYEFPLEPVTDGLVLEFNAVGRSNGAADHASWSYGNIAASFDGFGWSTADGWLHDDAGEPILRFLPGDTMTIPFMPFAVDTRETGGTIEVELATRNVRDYDSVVMSCLSNGRGFEIASQHTSLTSEQSSVSMQFKEDSRIRITYVVEQQNQNRLIYIYVNGIMCGVTLYPANDNFKQSPPVGLTIGAESCGLDLYRIRCYSKALTSREQVDNFICDRPTLAQRVNALQRNDILGENEEITVDDLPPTLPYMIIACPELPQAKGSNKTCDITYVDRANSAKSFTASGVDIDVQGTSSAGYKKKNFLIKLLNGLTLGDGSVVSVYGLRSDSIPVSTFCLKADVASSEGANNVELVRLYNRTCPYRHPAMQADPRIRYGIDGKPIVVFWQNTATGEVHFWGKYNFNNDKSTPEVFGWTEGYECWEIKNNTSNRVTFHKSDYGAGVENDFEAVYPKKSTDYTNLKVLTDWIVSTDRTIVSTDEEKAERLAKFKAEFEDHFVKIPMLFEYISTEVLHLNDNRAKNFFPTYDPTIQRWYPFPYDRDTGIGTNNEGQLVYDYDLEDTDQVGGHDVFMAQDSVLWCNIRDAFGDEIAELYRDLRNTTAEDGTVPFSFEAISKEFTDHQSVWPEVVWNEDAYEKYLRWLIQENDGSYLSMLQGTKASQRDFWLFNAFRYRDSKYQAGDANTNFITLRCYALEDITVTPYSHIWPRVKYGSYTVTQRGKRNVATTLENPLDKVDDTETYIYTADRLADVGDLAPHQVGYADFSPARKLQRLKLGDGAETYQNTKLTELYVGNNDLLILLDIQNCVALTMSPDLSACDSLETVKAKGSAITGIGLPKGGRLKVLELPDTMTNFTIQDQQNLESVTFEGYTKIATLRAENTPNIPVEAIINGSEEIDRVRLVGMEWTAESSDTLATTISRLKSCIGMDANGTNTKTAVVSGRVYVPSITDELLAEINDNFPDLVVVAGGTALYLIRYMDHDGTILHKEVYTEGSNATNPVADGTITAPTREGTEDTSYVFRDFGDLPTNIHANATLLAVYTVSYRVRFYNGTVLFGTTWGVSGGKAPIPEGTPTRESTAQYSFTFSNWSEEYLCVTGPTDVQAEYTATVRTYTVYYSDGVNLLQTVPNVPYGSSAAYTGEDPVKQGVDDPSEYEFAGFAPDGTNITGDTYCYAVFNFTGVVSAALVERTLSGEYTNETVERIGASAFAGTELSKVTCTAATSVGDSAFYNSPRLVAVELPVVEAVGDSAFQGCTALRDVSLPVARSIGMYAFYECDALTALVLPRAESLGAGAFWYCDALEVVDLPACGSIGAAAFIGCPALTAVILRSDTMCVAENSNLFIESNLKSGNGYVYVPAALMEAYAADSVWSAAGAAFRAIEDYPEICGGET